MPKGSLLVLFEIYIAGPNYRFFMNAPEYSVYSFEEEVLAPARKHGAPLPQGDLRFTVRTFEKRLVRGAAPAG